MESFHNWSVQHPRAVGLLFALFCGIAGYNAFRGGVAWSALSSGTARAASEALGG